MGINMDAINEAIEALGPVIAQRPMFDHIEVQSTKLLMEKFGTADKVDPQVQSTLFGIPVIICPDMDPGMVAALDRDGNVISTWWIGGPR